MCKTSWRWVSWGELIWMAAQHAGHRTCLTSFKEHRPTNSSLTRRCTPAGGLAHITPSRLASSRGRALSHRRRGRLAPWPALPQPRRLSRLGPLGVRHRRRPSSRASRRCRCRCRHRPRRAERRSCHHRLHATARALSSMAHGDEGGGGWGGGGWCCLFARRAAPLMVRSLHRQAKRSLTYLWGLDRPGSQGRRRPPPPRRAG